MTDAETLRELAGYLESEELGDDAIDVRAIADRIEEREKDKVPGPEQANDDPHEFSANPNLWRPEGPVKVEISLSPKTRRDPMAALSGLMAQESGSVDNDAKVAATEADALIAELDK